MVITFPQPPFSHRDLCRLLVDETACIRHPSAGKGILLTGRLSRDLILSGGRRGGPPPPRPDPGVMWFPLQCESLSENWGGHPRGTPATAVPSAVAWSLGRLEKAADDQ